jgi:hypothetical protein
MIMKSDNQAVLPPYWFIEDGFPGSPAQIPLLLLALTKNPRGLSTYPTSRSNLEVFLSLLSVSTTVTATTGLIAKCFTVTNVLMFVIHMIHMHLSTKYILNNLFLTH